VNLERLRWGDWIAAIAGLDLILMTFRGWYKVGGSDLYVTAWDALDNGRYLLIATGIVGILLLLLKAAQAQMSFPPGWLAAVVGFACTVYIAYRLATPPSDALDAALGIYIGLLGALGVTIGGLLSAREDAAASSATSATGRGAATEQPTEPAAEPVGAHAAPANETWSPAAPAASTSGWSPASPATAVAPATAAGAAAGAESGLRPGDQVVLTSGGPRFPAGTVAEVVEAFAGGALVEVKAADGVGERFEVPNSAFEPAATAGGGWSPAMPAPAGDDWGFDEPGSTATSEPPTDQAAATAPAEEKKVPWWKREIGGGKKKAGEAAAVGAVGAAAAGAAIAASDRDDEQKPGFFKRVFGGGNKDAATEAPEPETTPATGTAGVATAAESDTAVDEPAPEPTSTAGPEDVAGPSVIAADPEPTAMDPEPVAPAEAAPGLASEQAAASEPEEPASETAASEPESPAAAEPPSAGSDAAASAPADVPEPPASPAGAPEPASEAAPADAPGSAPRPDASEASGLSAGEAAAGAGAVAAGAGAAAAANGGDDDTPKRKRSSGSRQMPDEVAGAAGDVEEAPKRRRSSGSRKIPNEVLVEAPPKVGDEVQLKVGGGKFDAGTRGKVVDVFSAGVIVELSDDAGRTERLDLPFEAIGPAES
jgi:uncharacterized protein YodC (DUF2158 family)